MKKIVIYACVIVMILVVLIVFFVFDSVRNTSKNYSDVISSIENYCYTNEASYKCNVGSDDKIEISIMFKDCDVSFSIDKDKHLFYMSAENGKQEYSISELEFLVTLINFVSSRSFSLTEVNDVILNDNYSVLKSSQNQSLIVSHIKSFDFWEEFTMKYKVYDNGIHWLNITGRI